MASLLILEPYYGGSHKQLIDIITSRLHESTYQLIHLSSKKWHWRARASALTISQKIPLDHNFTTLFTSSVLSLAELIGLRPDLSRLKKVVYFHENQLIYPVQNVKERDFQFGYNQITTCLAADLILFNSAYNMTSFLSRIHPFLSLQPDTRPNSNMIVDQIRNVSRVCYFPLLLPVKPNIASKKSDCLYIVWPHRWEHDKDPHTFCAVINKLYDNDYDFKVSVVGEVFNEVPEVLRNLKEKISNRIHAFGYVHSKEDFYALLSISHVVVSTAKHEFYGVSMMEASWLGCYPLAPNRLVYPELYPSECLYNTEQQLYRRLESMCKDPMTVCSSDLELKFDIVAGEAPIQKLLECIT